MQMDSTDAISVRSEYRDENKRSDHKGTEQVLWMLTAPPVAKDDSTEISGVALL